MTEQNNAAEETTPQTENDSTSAVRMKCDAYCPKCTHGLCKDSSGHAGAHACNDCKHVWF